MSKSVPTPILGERFGRLRFVQLASRNRNGQLRWYCRCECGTEVLVYRSNVVRGLTNSCGCLQRERTSKVSRTHGASKTVLYRIWADMIGRCENKRRESYRYYGARGVKVCARWRRSYTAFAADMGMRPSPKHSIDRTNSRGNYEPGNCRWATATRQARNRRNTPLLSHRGKRLSIKDWSEIGGVPYLKFWKRVRLYGWSVGQALADGIKA